MLTQSPSAVPSAQSRTWSSAALAADAADDAPRASMIAAPRCCTVGMNSFSIHAWSTSSPAGLPSTCAWNTSGYCVAEWLPQIVMRVTDATGTPTFAASCAERAVVVEAGHRGEALARDRARVVHRDEAVGVGRVADHEHAHVVGRAGRERLALRGEDRAVDLEQLLALHALRARPGADEQRVVRRRRTRRWRRRWSRRRRRSGNAQSVSSITTPPSAGSAGVISSSCRITGWSGPSRSPLAMRKRRL